MLTFSTNLPIDVGHDQARSVYRVLTLRQLMSWCLAGEFHPSEQPQVVSLLCGERSAAERLGVLPACIYLDEAADQRFVRLSIDAPKEAHSE